MFNAQRKRVLRESLWKPWRPGRSKEHENVLPSLQSIQHEKCSTKEEDIQFLEFWKYEDVDTVQPGVNCLAGIIHDDHVADWLDQRGPFALKKSHADRKVTGGIRILICEQRGSDPITFPISRESYLRMEKYCHLSPATLPYFKNSCSNHTWRHNTTGGRNELALVAKPPSNGPITAPNLSLVHDLDASITTAFLYGPNLLSSPSNPFKHDRISCIPQISQLRDILEATAPLWAHPLLLPTALLTVSVDRAQAFCSSELEGKLSRVEEGLGISRLGPGDGKRSTEIMTREVNALVTDMVDVAHVPEWQVRFAGILGEMLDRTEDLWDVGDADTDEVRDMVGQLKTTAESVGRVVRGLRVRTDLQVEALHNSLAQTTNLLVAQLAATATSDGASVKTIALLTALFLPAIFVATLITTFTCSTHTTLATSTSSTSPSTNPLLSKNLRTYWATTIPLTILLLIAWLSWRSRASKLFSKAYATILAGIDPHGATTPSPGPLPARPPAANNNSTATAIAASTVAGVPGVPGVMGGSSAAAGTKGDDGRVRERPPTGQSRHVVDAMVPPPSAAAGVRRGYSRSSMWPTGPSGVSAPEVVGGGGGGGGTSGGWRGKRQQERGQNDIERLV
ncbi:hypothetical protein GTA08_BOTSDO10753 [Botryosphaeria dothidea]|uniref:Uncharacterized protein n=1 Tax=Botryosphaeria dothidea TaxID=55169 RepID=A0A8H4IGD1_9PEZI|nr:hypothetical protein GTA08_BOTSDO10753 [Botryosphaeria dothidea]